MRFPTGGRQRDATPQRSRSGEAKPVISPHVWQNEFVSNKSPFSGYYFSCKGYGHRAEEYKMMSRNRKLVCKRCNAYGHKISKCKNMHMLTSSYANKNLVVAPRNINDLCYNYNEFGH